MTDMFAKLAAPFEPNQVHWRAQMVYERGGKFSALALAYIDARDVMDRLDSVCTPAGWSNDCVETPKGRVFGRISIRVDDEWITKTDGAGDTDVEGEKGGISDALKRAAVLWGIGRYLYRLGNTWAECEVAKDQNGAAKKNKAGNLIFKSWTPAGEKQLADALSKVAVALVPAPTGPISDETRDWISLRLEARGIAVGELCAGFNVPSLKSLNYEQIDDVKTWIRNWQKEAA